MAYLAATLRASYLWLRGNGLDSMLRGLLILATGLGVSVAIIGGIVFLLHGAHPLNLDDRFQVSRLAFLAGGIPLFSWTCPLAKNTRGASAYFAFIAGILAVTAAQAFL